MKVKEIMVEKVVTFSPESSATGSPIKPSNHRFKNSSKPFGEGRIIRKADEGSDCEEGMALDLSRAVQAEKERLNTISC
ncbi:MAG: hypothetical protein QF829_04820 [Candidatus Hydrothermarchaeota archaeon]|jgi:hypothetical protein|nr:hypothetical protein [Candidatus Hydrothermarchaeota archaeon]